MQCAALTGISPDVIKELKQGKSRTLELQSTHNVVTAGTVEPGMPVFLTSVNIEDLGDGRPGYHSRNPLRYHQHETDGGIYTGIYL